MGQRGLKQPHTESIPPRLRYRRKEEGARPRPHAALSPFSHTTNAVATEHLETRADCHIAIISMLYLPHIPSFFSEFFFWLIDYSFLYKQGASRSRELPSILLAPLPRVIFYFVSDRLSREKNKKQQHFLGPYLTISMKNKI